MTLPVPGNESLTEGAGGVHGSTRHTTVPPIAKAASWPTARVSVATEVIRNMSTALSRISTPKAWREVPAGIVAPQEPGDPAGSRLTLDSPSTPTRSGSSCGPERVNFVRPYAGELPWGFSSGAFYDSPSAGIEARRASLLGLELRVTRPAAPGQGELCRTQKKSRT